MTTHQTPHPEKLRPGFTLVELLVGMTIIAILAGLLTVAISGGLRRAREFAITNEMTQLESALEQFRNQYGIYPPSFKEMAQIQAADGDVAAANRVLDFLNSVAPNNAESTTDANGQRRIDVWWIQVGSELADASNNPGADLVFWLSGLAKNKQFPLTQPAFDGDGNAVPLAAHSANPLDNGIERQVFFEFVPQRLLVNGGVAGYSHEENKSTPFLYLDAQNYLPTIAGGNPQANGAYCLPGFTDDDYNLILDGTLQFGSPLFKQMYPNADSYQLISYGLDGEPGVATPPNRVSDCGARGADNYVNFGGQAITKLETIVLELN